MKLGIKLISFAMLIAFCCSTSIVRASGCDCGVGEEGLHCDLAHSHSFRDDCDGEAGTIPAPVQGTLISSTFKAQVTDDRCEDEGQTSTPPAESTTVSWTAGANWSITIPYCGTFGGNYEQSHEETRNAAVPPPCEMRTTTWYERCYNCTVTIPVTYTITEELGYWFNPGFPYPAEWVVCDSEVTECGTDDEVANGTLKELYKQTTSPACPECVECEVNDPPANL